MDVIVAAEDQREEVVAFIARVNAAPEHHCGYIGVTPESVRSDLGQLEPSPDDSVFLMQGGDGAIKGCMALEWDAALGRAWLWGPWVDAPASEWMAIAKMLHARAMSALPGSITDTELWCDAANANIQALAAAQGYATYKKAAVFTFPRKALGNVPNARGISLEEPRFEAFAALHDELFPGTYFNGRQMIERRGDHRSVLTCGEEASCWGYIASRVDLEAGGGDIDFMGVEKSHRGIGMGRDLLHAGLHWIFSFPEVKEAASTVEPDNQAAMNLYLATGFTHERTTVAFRRKRGEA